MTWVEINIVTDGLSKSCLNFGFGGSQSYFGSFSSESIYGSISVISLLDTQYHFYFSIILKIIDNYASTVLAEEQFLFLIWESYSFTELNSINREPY